MKINNLSFPYPVLGLGDDIMPKPYFEHIPQFLQNNDSYIFSISVVMGNNDIYKLLKEGKAVYVCEVECVHTKYRKCFKSNVSKFKVDIPRQCVGKKVTFEVTIVCIENIKSYVNSNLHEDYDGYSFDLEPGDLLAYIDRFEYDFDINYAQIRSMGSFMQITENKNSENVYFNFEGDKIDIKLPTVQYEKYKSEISKNKVFQDIVHSSIVMNALVAALLKYDSMEENQKLWERTLKYRIDTEPELARFAETLQADKDINEIIDLAQTLLLNPYRRMFDILPELNFRGGEEE